MFFESIILHFISRNIFSLQYNADLWLSLAVYFFKLNFVETQMKND